MPELPEVEVVKRSLEPCLVGRWFTSVDVRFPTLREPLDADALGSLVNRPIHRLRRRAKYLLIDVADGSTLVIHLGMSGRFTVVDEAEPFAPHEHLAFGLRGGGRLRLVDPRRFGSAFVRPTDALESDSHFAHLGVEPLSSALDGPYLASRARGRRGPIKSFLMDGRVVVGVGNIYAAEALWRARVHPTRSVARIADATWQRLADTARQVLTDAIAEGGTTLADFRDGEGNAGYFQVSLDAYGREGEPCRRCGRPLRRIVQSNRSTFYCPGCQR